jgi:hypothetical protein
MLVFVMIKYFIYYVLAVHREHFNPGKTNTALRKKEMSWNCFISCSKFEQVPW